LTSFKSYFSFSNILSLEMVKMVCSPTSRLLRMPRLSCWKCDMEEKRSEWRDLCCSMIVVVNTNVVLILQEI
jgi:hypothetical protein